MYDVKSNVLCIKPGAALRFEYVARVASIVPDEFLIWTFNVSLALVVVVSAVSIWRQYDRLTAVAVDGMLTCW